VTTAPATTAPATTAAAVEVTAHPAGYRRAVRSEWIKARSLRSTWILVAFALAAFVGVPTLVVANASDVGTSSSAEVMGVLYFGLDFVLLLVAVLGALLTTSEFTTGMARNTFTATPGRGKVLAAKATIAGLFALAIGIVGLATAWAVNAGGLADLGVSIDLGDTATMRALLVNQLSIVVFAMLAVALGVLLRSSVGAIFTIVAMQLILPGVLAIVPNTIANWVGAVLPSAAASAAVATEPLAAGQIGLDSGWGLVVLLAWAVVPMAGALVSLRARDI